MAAHTPLKMAKGRESNGYAGTVMKSRALGAAGV